MAQTYRPKGGKPTTIVQPGFALIATALTAHSVGKGLRVGASLALGGHMRARGGASPLTKVSSARYRARGRARERQAAGLALSSSGSFGRPS